MGLNVIGVDAKPDIYDDDLQGVTDPEAKRKANGNALLSRLFDEESKLN